jgi:hypothetical protein
MRIACNELPDPLPAESSTMKLNHNLILGAILVSMSAVLFPHAYGGYISAKDSIPNLLALTPEPNGLRVQSEVLPLLPVGDRGSVARVLLESQQDLAASLHKLNLTQAHARERLAGIHCVAWALVFAVGAVIMFVYRQRKPSDA